MAVHTWYAQGHRARYATLMHNGVVEHKMLLAKNQQYVYAPDATTRMTINVEHNKVCIVESSCPNKVCVHSGWIEMPGSTLVCVPNHVVITIEGKQDVDAVTY